MYSSQFKLDCLHKIEESIDVPLSGSIIKTDKAIRLNCVIAGKPYKKNLINPLDVDTAEYLRKHQIISNYGVTKDGIKMYKNELFCGYDHRGVPYQYMRPITFKWEDIEISAAQWQGMAAKDEWERVKELTMNELPPANMVKAAGKVIKMVRNNFSSNAA